MLPLIRTEAAIFSILFALINYPKHKNMALIPMIAIPLVFIINKLTDNLGYLHILNTTFITGQSSLPKNAIISTDYLDYIKLFSFAIRTFLSSIEMFVFSLFFLAVYIEGKINLNDSKDLIMLCCIMTILCYFILFPHFRHPFSYNVAIVLLSLAKIQNKIGELNIIGIYKNSCFKVTEK